MNVHHQVERLFPQLRQHAGRVSEPNRLFAVGQQPFEQVVHGQIAGGADQHLVAATHGLTDQFHERRGLARAGRAVDHGHVGRGQGEADGLALRLVQRFIEGVMVRRRSEVRRPLAHQDAAQLGEPVALGRTGALQRLPLSQPCGLVVGAVHAKDGVFVRVERVVDRDAHQRLFAVADHAAPAGVADLALERQQHRRAGLQPRPRQPCAAALGQRQDEAAAQPGGLVAHDEVEQAVAAALGLGGGQPAYALQRLPGLGLRFEFQQGGQSSKMVVR